MTTGLPVVALDAEGQADACRDARGPLGASHAMPDRDKTHLDPPCEN
jgi:hypothetical protein